MLSTGTNRQASALIIVVVFLVLMSALLVAFYSRVSTDLANSRSYAEGVNVTRLADSAVGVAMGQIREATTVPNGAWASQPGMIRVYGNGKDANSAVHAFYKLYSSHDMIVSGREVSGFDPDQFDQAASPAPLEVPLGKGGWQEQPAFFTDLNKPAIVPSAIRTTGGARADEEKRYPIFDPSVAALRDPDAASPDSFERPWKIEGSEVVLPKKLRADTGSPGANEAPMPVRWIYMLRDGTLTAPAPLAGPATAATGSRATWRSVQGNKIAIPTRDNPIVGRIAFWADDDSCKVNVNTAGGFVESGSSDPEFAGSYWDTPRMQTDFDRGIVERGGAGIGRMVKPGLALAQPGRNEFQRYPGHPATTSLSLILNGILSTQPGAAPGMFDSEKLYTWTPRLMPGGSRGGTMKIDPLVDRVLPIKSGKDPLDAPGHPLNGDTFHPFQSVDEMLFAPINRERIPATEYLGLPGDALTARSLDRARFFLTAANHAPDLNLHGRPRVTIWPIWPTTTRSYADRNSGQDLLVRFCSIAGNRAFIFTRKDPTHPNADFNLAGASILPDGASEDNRWLFGYLRDLTTARVPGFDGSFERKLTAQGRDQLLAQIFDYIRGINLRDASRDTPGASPSMSLRFSRDGLVFPTRATVGKNEISGIGRVPTITEAALVFHHAGFIATERASGKERMVYDPRELDTPAFRQSHTVTGRLVRAFLLTETFNPMQGYSPVGEATNNRRGRTRLIAHEITLPADFEIRTPAMTAAAKLGLQGTRTNTYDLTAGMTWGGRSFGGTEGFMHTLFGKTNHAPGVRYYPFQTPCRDHSPIPEGIRIPPGDTTFTFKGGPMEIKINIGENRYQTLKLKWPDGVNWPVPTPAVWADLGGFDPAVPGHDSGAIMKMACFLPERIRWSEEHSLNPDNRPGGDGKHYDKRWRQILQPGDTVRSLIIGGADPVDSDPRIAAAKPAHDLLRPHPAYATAARHAQTLRRGDGAFYIPDTAHGSLIKLPVGKNYDRNKSPDLPGGVLASRSRDTYIPADFDTGIGNYPDGGYAGKADEGNTTWQWLDPSDRQQKLVEPYFSAHPYDPPFDTHFSPNRQITSGVTFGSLSPRGRGWETLLFSPEPAGPRHPGLESPRDHLLLDLFTMPVVEPFAISEPFATAGKVNLNYPIMPFGYLKRTTALRSALQSVRVTAIPQDRVGEYKTGTFDATGKNNNLPQNFRYPVDRDATLRGFDAFFAEYKHNHAAGFFKSASEICDRHLYPKGTTHSGTVPFDSAAGQGIRENFWGQSALTGDNLREKPYGDLYPRLTTKSNTYTVHYHVQTLRQRPPASGKPEDWAVWDETRDTVLSDLRGQTTIERYIDPGDKRLLPTPGPDRINVETDSLETAYRFRILRHKQNTVK